MNNDPRRAPDWPDPENYTTFRRAIIVLALAVLVTIAVSFAALFGLRALFALWH